MVDRREGIVYDGGSDRNYQNMAKGQGPGRRIGTREKLTVNYGR